jgi:hypothetical protein
MVDAGCFMPGGNTCSRNVLRTGHPHKMRPNTLNARPLPPRSSK